MTAVYDVNVLDIKCKRKKRKRDKKILKRNK